MSSSPYRPYAADFSEKYHWSALPTARIPMIEHAWLASTDPAAMLHYLDPGNARVGKVSDPDTSHLWTPRKLRLFACACCRQVWDKLIDLRSRRAVEVAERYAEGRATDEELEAASGSMATVGSSGTFEYAPAWACHREISYGVWALVGAGREWPVGQREAQADLVRCVFGNPWKPVALPRLCWNGEIYDRCQNCKRIPCSCQNHWEERQPCLWLTPAALSLARDIHADRDWAALPVLADLLEDGGCPGEVACGGCLYRVQTYPDYPGEVVPVGPGVHPQCVRCGGTGHVHNPLLAHLRSSGPHARGCHALEAIWGEE